MSDYPDGDLVVLSADSQTEAAVRGIMTRHQSLRTRELLRERVTMIVHPNHDPGCRTTASQYLRPFIRSHQYALVVCDHDGCGAEDSPADHIRQSIVNELSRNGWNGRCEAIVIVPELESWVWSGSRHVARAIGWGNELISVQQWLEDQGMWLPGAPKPHRPKEALDSALAEMREQRSASMFEDLAKRVTFRYCTDPAFRLLSDTFHAWFPGSTID